MYLSVELEHSVFEMEMAHTETMSAYIIVNSGIRRLDMAHTSKRVCMNN